MYQTQWRSSEVIAEVLAGRTLTDCITALWRKVPQLEPRQRAAIQDICYGTLRRLGELEYMLEQLLERPVTDPVLHGLLLTTLYQLAWGRSAPHALVDHAVEVASRINAGRAKGLVNAVLRNFLRRQAALMAESAADPTARWNHPDWWVAAMRQAYPLQAEAILQANNQHPPLTLRINPRKISQSDYHARLLAEGLPGQLLGDYGIRLDTPVGVDRLPGFAEGLCSVQDWGAQLAAPLLDVADGMRVLDACAAPGGKTGHLLELADLHLTALDHDGARLQRVRSNLQRLELTANIVSGDAARPAQWWDGQPFDRILADVPCSATGVARRHPDIKWLRRSSDFAQFATQQAAILDALWGCLATGGKLLYVTCSVFPEENQQQIAAFVARQADARQLPLALPSSSTSLLASPNSGQLLPNDCHDGFFYALLAKD